ncbi:MAG: hypothetical protein EZS28_002244 [Streblomastix strix]|uniref:Uncharacterized protein n=1 Tax=Streblomastix strix TaxID=222440 RepID=A0A5J4X6U3_9EUKA|nr:MAG: hypothetical protein EZS28_002244 [Streblomastix strix]
MPDLSCAGKIAEEVKIDRYKRIAEGKRILFSFYGIPEPNQCKFLKDYPGYNWNDANKVAEKINININCYEYVSEGFEADDKKPKYQRLISYPDMKVDGRKSYNIFLLNDAIVDNISFEKFIEDIGQAKFQENDSLQASNEIATIYMPGDVTSVIKDENRARQIFYNENRFSCDEDIFENMAQLFIAVVKTHLPEEFINEFIDFPVIW